MSEVRQVQALSSPDSAEPHSNIVKTILHAAWMAIVIGVVIQLILLAVAASSGSPQGAKKFVTELTQKVTWSVVVCAGLVLGTAASKLRAPAMGLAGLLAAPLAFNVARVAQKSTAAALGVVGGAGGGPSPFVLALVKALEYGLLGAMIGWLDRRNYGVKSHVTVGLGVGIVFSALTLFLTIHGAAQTPPSAVLVSRSVNEMVFPFGCTLAIYAAERLSRHVKG